MQFDKLNIRLLENLKKAGYTILASHNNLFKETVYWFPEKVDDISDYLLDLGLSGELSNDPSILIIDDAINNIKEQHLFGYVFL